MMKFMIFLLATDWRILRFYSPQPIGEFHGLATDWRNSRFFPWIWLTNFAIFSRHRLTNFAIFSHDRLTNLTIFSRDQLANFTVFSSIDRLTFVIFFLYFIEEIDDFFPMANGCISWFCYGIAFGIDSVQYFNYLNLHVRAKYNFLPLLFTYVGAFKLSTSEVKRVLSF